MYLSKEEEWNIFNSSIRLEEWTEHIENAKRNADGIAPHGHQLIDLGEATLIRLDSGNEGHLNWWTHAAFNGFFVMKREGVDGKRLLARFTRQGQLEWVVSIAAEDGLSTRRDEPALDFKGAAVEGGDLVLYGRGQLVQPKEKGPADSYAVTAFRIPVERLPPMKDYP
ncbi:hypothetical protein ASD88_09830 [Pelomonas sp. Root662]|nr:hypothetical protein ASC81_09830 [Pelomonas sp. Root405]KRA73719.1 hypothetical protein ASD88_09830 [Pelomonas sp. Root662]